MVDVEPLIAQQISTAWIFRSASMDVLSLAPRSGGGEKNVFVEIRRRRVHRRGVPDVRGLGRRHSERAHARMAEFPPRRNTRGRQ
jgi:hypothetical protein